MLKAGRAEELAGRLNRKRVGSYPPETLLFVDGVHAKLCDAGWNTVVGGRAKRPSFPLADVTADDVEAVAVVPDPTGGQPTAPGP